MWTSKLTSLIDSISPTRILKLVNQYQERNGYYSSTSVLKKLPKMTRITGPQERSEILYRCNNQKLILQYDNVLPSNSKGNLPPDCGCLTSSFRGSFPQKNVEGLSFQYVHDVTTVFALKRYFREKNFRIRGLLI